MKRFTLILCLIFFVSMEQSISKDFFWVNPFPTYQDIKSSFFVDANTGYIGGSKGFVMKTTNTGETWTQLATSIGGDILSIFFVDSNTGFFSGSIGKLYKTTDGGNSFSKLNIDTEKDICDIYFIDSKIGYVAGFDGVFKTTDGGNTWVLIKDAKTYRVWFINESVGFYITSSNFPLIYKTTDGGDTWEKKIKGRWTMSMYFTDENTGWVGSSYGNFAYTTDQGDTWVEKDVIDGDIRDIHFFDKDNGILSCDGGKIYMTKNGGVTWTEKTSNTNADLWAVWFIDQNNVIAGGNSGVVTISNDCGKKWKVINSGVSEEIINVEFSGNNTWVLFSTGLNHGITSINQLKRSTDNGKSWENFKIGNSISISFIDFIDDNLGYAVVYCDNGTTFPDKKVFETTDGGANWKESETLLFQENSNIFLINKSKALSFSNYSGYTYTTDGGNNWNNITGLEISWQYDFQDLFFLDDNNGWIISDEGIFFTSDGGANWENISSREGGMIRFFNKDEGIVINGEYSGDGEIFYTDDGGYSWAKVIDDLSYLTCIEIIEGKAYARAGSGMLTSQDNGITWVLEYNLHCNNKLEKIYGVKKSNIFVSGKKGTLLSNNQYERPGNEILVGVNEENIQSPKKENNLSVFPNPAGNILNIYSLSQNSNISRIEIFDCRGNLVNTVSDISMEKGVITIDIANFKNGSYYLKTVSKKGNEYINFIIYH